MVRLVYQRWLECEVLEGRGVPMWSWPVALSDGRVILTLLYRPLRGPGTGKGAVTTVILEVDAWGEARVWGPGAGYAAGVVFYANVADELFGLDLTGPGKVYVCKADGAHLYTLETTVRMDCPVAPESFRQRDGRLMWVDGKERRMVADLVEGVPVNVREGEWVEDAEDMEVHFPHTHVTREGSLLVLDFEVMGRVSRYRIEG